VAYLVSTITGAEYPLARREEFAENGESLEVRMPHIRSARIRPGNHVAERFRDFLPFEAPDIDCSLGEGNTPLLRGDLRLTEFAGIPDLFLKNETQNPTWSFKDRGSLTCVWMAREQGENLLATISTGNMGHSVAAYAARAGLRAIVFVPEFATREKLAAMSIHGASIVRVHAPDYSAMKRRLLDLAARLRFRLVSGNGPVRAEGYKLTAFELFQQMGGNVPDYVAVPTSACGHCRGLFKGFRELKEAGLTPHLPKMIVVQAANNAPIVTGIRRGLDTVVPFSNFHTIAEAITTGNPQGGDEIVRKAKEFGWPAMAVTEEEILEGQTLLARSGYFVEPAAATTLHAVRNLVQKGELKRDASVVLMLTGSGLKDLEALAHHDARVIDTGVDEAEKTISSLL
jgi:threonine synthase